MRSLISEIRDVGEFTSGTNGRLSRPLVSERSAASVGPFSSPARVGARAETPVPTK